MKARIFLLMILLIIALGLYSAVKNIKPNVPVSETKTVATTTIIDL